MAMTRLARAEDERVLKSLGGTRTALIRNNAPQSEIAAVEQQIAIARAERAVRHALRVIPAAERQRIAKDLLAA